MLHILRSVKTTQNETTVILNLMINAVEAMSGVSEGSRDLLIGSEKDAAGGALVSVQDSGPGLPRDCPRDCPPTALTECSMPFTPPKPAAWAWDYQFLVRSSSNTVDACGF